MYKQKRSTTIHIAVKVKTASNCIWHILGEAAKIKINYFLNGSAINASPSELNGSRNFFFLKLPLLSYAESVIVWFGSTHQIIKIQKIDKSVHNHTSTELGEKLIQICTI